MTTSTLPSSIEIERHKAAISRNTLSRPVRLAFEAGFFEPNSSFFDYGCGRGTDVSLISELGYLSSGWDPHFSPNNLNKEADIVNIGYVINVIESLKERKEALTKAWSLAKKVLIVAAQILVGNYSNALFSYNDGIITSRNTFQKYYEQQELKAYIDETLQVDSVPVGPGVYFVFRDETLAQKFRAARFYSRTSAPKIRTKVKSFEDYKELLSPLMDFVAKRGRLPLQGELLSEKEICSEFGNFTRAFSLIQQATSKDEWDAISEKHKQDLLVYIALSKFGQRPKFAVLPTELQNDIKVFFTNYKQACETADQMLFSLRDMEALKAKCKSSKIGKLVNDSLYVHVSAIESLDPKLRLYEGCASRAFGRMDGATLVKFRIDKPKISYLFYPDFDADPHPALYGSMQIDFLDLTCHYRDYTSSLNPVVLHRKETFVTEDYPLHSKFARLSQQEEKWGLLDNPSTIGTKRGWQERLKEKSAELRGHRLVRTKK